MIALHEVEEILALGHETRSFEAKGTGSTHDKRYVAKVARAAMAMGNLHDGGVVCLGIDDDQMTAMLPGLDAVRLSEWSNFDNVSDALARYVDPPLAFELLMFTLSSGVDIRVLEVAEFDRDPHVCKRTFPGELTQGQTYVRPRGKPASVPIPSAQEARELHDLAITKGVRDFMRRAASAGLLPAGAVVPEPEDVERAAFDREADVAWAAHTPIDTVLPDAAFIEVSVRPGPYENARLRPDELEGFVTEHQVRLRGWPVPYVDGRSNLTRHRTWIGQDIEPDVVPHIEAWRLFESGQFLQRRILATDLRSAVELEPTDADATGAVAVWDVLLYLVEVAELGARYATALGADNVGFEAALQGVAGRQLISGDSRREIHGPYVVADNRLSNTAVIPVAQLLANTRDVGVRLTQGLLSQFGLTVPDEVLFDWQEQVFGNG